MHCSIVEINHSFKTCLDWFYFFSKFDLRQWYIENSRYPLESLWNKTFLSRYITAIHHGSAWSMIHYCAILHSRQRTENKQGLLHELMCTAKVMTLTALFGDDHSQREPGQRDLGELGLSLPLCFMNPDEIDHFATNQRRMVNSDPALPMEIRFHPLPFRFAVK